MHLTPHSHVCCLFLGFLAISVAWTAPLYWVWDLKTIVSELHPGLNKFFFSAGHQACGAPPAEKKEKPTKWQRFFYPFISAEAEEEEKKEKNSPAPSQEDLPANIHGHDHTKNVKVQPGLPRGGVQPGATHEGVQPGALSPPACMETYNAHHLPPLQYNVKGGFGLSMELAVTGNE
ncbi:hypothetical protein F5880DRAFT_1731583, partial [Lentinula raphanica]